MYSIKCIIALHEFWSVFQACVRRYQCNKRYGLWLAVTVFSPPRSNKRTRSPRNSAPDSSKIYTESLHILCDMLREFGYHKLNRMSSIGPADVSKCMALAKSGCYMGHIFTRSQFSLLYCTSSYAGTLYAYFTKGFKANGAELHEGEKNRYFRW